MKKGLTYTTSIFIFGMDLTVNIAQVQLQSSMSNRRGINEP